MDCYQIVTPNNPGFVAGFIVDNNRVFLAAPIIHYMQGWTFDEVEKYVRMRGWKLNGPI